MFRWNENRKEVLSTGTIPLLNNKALIEICKDKWEFYKVLLLSHPRHAIPTTIEASFGEYPLPFLLKPRQGYGSKGIIKVTSKSEFEMHKERIGKDLIQQPTVGRDDEEYTVSAFFDKKSMLLDYLPLKRKLSAEGYTQEAELAEFDFTAMISELASTFKPIGPTNFQFRKEKDEMKLLEINPRISSATSIRTAMGYNESKMSVDYFLSNRSPSKLDRSTIRGARAIRYIEDHIFL
jgi:carbamoyl-phosphate synthase large subunit